MMLHEPPPHDHQHRRPSLDLSHGPPLQSHPSTPAMSTSSSHPTLLHLDRRRESIVANSSLRSHPFLAMGNTAGKVIDEDNEDDVVSFVPRRFPCLAPNAAIQTPPAETTPLPKADTTSQHRHTPSPQPLPRSTSRPPRTHHRALSESVATLSTPPRRAMGLVRKLSFRPREKSATPAAHSPPPDNSADDGLEVLSKDQQDDVIVPGKSGLVRSASATSSSSRQRNVRSPRFFSPEPVIAETPEAQQKPEPQANPMKQAIPPSPEAASQRTSKDVMPRRSPPHSSSLKRGPVSPSKSTHRNPLSSSRRAEREWKAKLAALSLASPTPPSEPAPSGGPRPPPRRITKLPGSDHDPRGMVYSSSRSRHPNSSSRIPRSKRSFEALSSLAADPSPPLSAFGQTFSLISRSSSTPSVKPKSRQSRPPKPSRAPLSPMVQEPLSPVLDAVNPLIGLRSEHRPLPPVPVESPAPSLCGSKLSYAPTFGYPTPHPSQPNTVTSTPQALSMALPRRDLPIWKPDQRVVVAHSSVPDLRAPAKPTRTGSAGTGDSRSHTPGTTSTPVPECEIPSEILPDEQLHDSPKCAPFKIPVQDYSPKVHNTFTHSRRLSRELLAHGLEPRSTSLAAVTSPEGDEEHPVYNLRRVYDLTPGLESGGRRPRKTGFPKDDLQRWLQGAAR